MIKALAKSLRALEDRYFWKIVFLCSLISLLFFGAFVAAIDHLAQQYLYGFLYDWLFGWLGAALAIFIGYFLFPLTFPLISLLFLDKVASHMEAKHYLDASEVREASFWRIIYPTIKFVLVSLILNILIFPFYLFPVLGQVLYFVVNGYLYGREYFEIIALRYHNHKEMRQLRKGQRTKLLMGGLIIIGSFMVPILNLITPILATVFMVHLYHGIAKHT